MTKDEIIKFLMTRPQFLPETPVGVVEEIHTYSIVSKPSFIAISVDEGEFIEIPKYEFMSSEQLCSDTEFYIKNQDYDAAQSCIECALRVDGSNEDKNWKVYYYAGFIALKQKIYDASINLITYSMELGCPYLRKCFDYMAISASILGKTDDAHKYYEMAIEQTPSDPEVWHNIGGFYWDNNALAKAVNAYVKALKCDIKYFPTYQELTNLSKELGNKSLSEIYLKAYSEKETISHETLDRTEKWATNL